MRALEGLDVSTTKPTIGSGSQSVRAICGLRRRIEAPHRIEAPPSAAGASGVEENEGKNDRALASVEQRIETFRRMADEVDECEMSRQQEGRSASVEAEQKSNTADQLDHASDHVDRRHRQIVEEGAIGNAEQFRGRMLQQRQRDRDARNAQNARRPGRKETVEFHGWLLLQDNYRL